MEVTRHFTASVYVVADGAVALHEHPKIDSWLPPGGHVDRGELPHETARKEVYEETGLDVELIAERSDVASETVEPLPEPQHLQLADVNVCDGVATHQHVDMLYYARADSREIDPQGEDEAPASAWKWFDDEDLRAAEHLDADVVEVGLRAIRTVAGETDR